MGAEFQVLESKIGLLFKTRRARGQSWTALDTAIQVGVIKRSKHYLAFLGLFIFIFLLYLRPNELFPALGEAPIVKLWTIAALAIFIISKRIEGERTIWTIEAKMMLTITALAVLFLPIAASREESWEILSEMYLKVLVIFILMNNLIDTRERLIAVLRLVVTFGAAHSFLALQSYFKGEFIFRGRIQGHLGGMFSNPNDLATTFCLLFPLAVALALTSKKYWRIYFAACSLSLAGGVMASFSRSGFLAMVAACGMISWKLSQGRRTKWVVAAIPLLLALWIFLPGNYKYRLVTIVEVKEDKTRSAQERIELLEKALWVTYDRSFLGVGMGNMAIFSNHEQVSHNSYLEIFVELSIFGLIAYLTIIISPLRSLRRIELETAHAPPGNLRLKYYMSICMQGAMAAYVVSGLFGSIQYQWYLYTTAAYAIALRRIHEIDVAQGEVVDKPIEVKGLLLHSIWKKGVLWSYFQYGKGVLMTLIGRKQ